MKTVCFRVCSLLILAAFNAGVATAQTGAFTAHRALYNLSLEQARSGSGISGVTGKMAVEWNDSCAGWAFEYRSVIDVTFDEETPVRLTSNAATWEASDGKTYRFSVRHKTNGREVERIEGVARLAGPNGAGQTELTHPEPRKIDLPKGTLFPVAHSLAIMKAAKSGSAPRFVSRTVFDGMDEEGLYQVNAVIGPAKESPGTNAAWKEQMKKVPSWSVTLAYFSLKSSKAAPDHEIKMNLFANGVSDDLIMDFDDFIVRARINKVELLPTPSCG